MSIERYVVGHATGWFEVCVEVPSECYEKCTNWPRALRLLERAIETAVKTIHKNINDFEPDNGFGILGWRPDTGDSPVHTCRLQNGNILAYETFEFLYGNRIWQLPYAAGKAGFEYRKCN